MGVRMEALLEELRADEYAAQESWAAGPGGQMEEVRAERERLDADRAAFHREQSWRTDHPVEWDAWHAMQPYWYPPLRLPAEEYGFPEFLAEVRKAPPGGRLGRKDDRLPFQPGNLVWDESPSACDTAHRTEAATTDPNQAILDWLERIQQGQAVAAVKEAYTTEEAAKRVGRSEWTVRQYCNRGQVEGAHKVRGKGRTGEWRLPHAAVVRLQAEGPSPVGTFLTR